MEASTAGEAIEMMLEKKKISSKINYDVLRQLNSRGTGSGRGSSPSRTAPVPSAAAGRKRLHRRHKKTSGAGGDLSSSANVIGKR